MELATVLGTVEASTKAEELIGVKLLIIQPIDHKDSKKGDPLVAVDTVQAGVGDKVYWVTGREGAIALPKNFVAVDAAIVGIVDDVETV